MSKSITVTKLTCFCSGNIVRSVVGVYDPATGPLLCGPGSKRQFRKVTTYHCNNCGICYERSIIDQRLTEAG